MQSNHNLIERFDLLTVGPSTPCKIWKTSVLVSELNTNSNISAWETSLALLGDSLSISMRLKDQMLTGCVTSNLGATKEALAIRKHLTKRNLWFLEGQPFDMPVSNLYIDPQGNSLAFGCFFEMGESLETCLIPLSNHTLCASWLYLDAYHWCEERIFKIMGLISFKSLFLNLGYRKTIDSSLFHKIASQRKDGATVLQISVDDFSVYNRDCELPRNWLLILTAGKRGIQLVNKNDRLEAPSSHLTNFHDATGAGSAVSAKFLEIIAAGSSIDLGIVIERLEAAGAKQCGVLGPLSPNDSAMLRRKGV